jgi:hypothetical protein
VGEAVQEISGAHESDVDMIGHFVGTLVAMRRISASKKAMSKIYVTARAMSRRFSGVNLYDFMIEVVRNRNISEDCLHIVRQLSQFSLGPGIIMDSFVRERVNWTSLYKYLGCWSKNQILSSLDVVLSFFNKPTPQLQEEILQFQWAAPNYFEGKDVEKLFTVERYEKCIRNVCRNFKLEFPVEFKRRMLRVTLDQELEAYQQGEVEDEDFRYSFKVISGGNEDIMKEALKYVSEAAEELGQYLMVMRHPTTVRGRHGLSKKPVCRQPFNEALHRLGRECGETRLIEDKDDVKFLSAELKVSEHITVLMHVAPKLFSDVDEVDLLTIRTKGKVVAVLPKVFPQTLKSIGGALRESAMGQTVFVHKGNRMRQFCKEVLRWEPENIKDVFRMCLEKG